jgi:hypothetical protein
VDSAARAAAGLAFRGLAQSFGNSGVFGRQPETSVEIADVLPLAQRALIENGLHGVLKFLNQRAPHRFTALYRLEPGHVLHNVAVFDKHKHLDALDLRVVPLKDSFCQFVLRDGVFLTETSGSDPRLAGHPYAGPVNCYVGVPVEMGEELRGTLCHFDTEDHRLPDCRVPPDVGSRCSPAALSRRCAADLMRFAPMPLVCVLHGRRQQRSGHRPPR